MDGAGLVACRLGHPLRRFAGGRDQGDRLARLELLQGFYDDPDHGRLAGPGQAGDAGDLVSYRRYGGVDLALDALRHELGLNARNQVDDIPVRLGRGLRDLPQALRHIGFATERGPLVNQRLARADVADEVAPVFKAADAFDQQRVWDREDAAGELDEAVPAQCCMALAHGLVEAVQEARVDALLIIQGRAELARHAVGFEEADTGDLAREPIGVFGDDLRRGRAVFLQDARDRARSDAGRV